MQANSLVHKKQNAQIKQRKAMTDKNIKKKTTDIVPVVSGSSALSKPSKVSSIPKSKKDDDDIEELTQSMLMLVLFLIILSLLPYIVNATYNSVNPAVPLSNDDYPTTAQHVGMFYYKITPEVQPNELRMVGENSTGAFEHILVSKST